MGGHPSNDCCSEISSVVAVVEEEDREKKERLRWIGIKNRSAALIVQHAKIALSLFDSDNDDSFLRESRREQEGC